MTATDGGTGWAVWIVGLPGSGKSNLARWLHETLGNRGIPVELMQMDLCRKRYTPTPDYSEAERERAYAMFVDEAAALVGQGRGVLMDGSAYRQSMREYARQRIPRFAEIHVQCALHAAISREARRTQGLVMADLYRKALERQQTGKEVPGLGQVIGVDVLFEEDPAAELIIDNTHLPKERTREIALHFLEQWLKRHVPQQAGIA